MSKQRQHQTARELAFVSLVAGCGPKSLAVSPVSLAKFHQQNRVSNSHSTFQLQGLALNAVCPSPACALHTLLLVLKGLFNLFTCLFSQMFLEILECQSLLWASQVFFSYRPDLQSPL